MDVGVGGRRVGMIWRHRERGLEEAVSFCAQPRAGTSSQWAPPRHICSCTGVGQPAGDPERATARAPGSHRGSQRATEGPQRGTERYRATAQTPGPNRSQTMHCVAARTV